MKCELVYDGSEVHIPQEWEPREDQFKGTPSEQLIEVAGRSCYDSAGTGRASGDYHRNIITQQKHLSVIEHPHFTIDVSSALSPEVWLGIPDCSAWRTAADTVRLTCNLRHVFEWPHNIIYKCDRYGVQGQIDRWHRVLTQAAAKLIPSVVTSERLPTDDEWRFVEPESDAEAHVSLFLEESRVWSHEMVRHRCNISQRSGRFVDDTDRDDCIHPLLRDYLNELGSMKPETGWSEEDWAKWRAANPGQEFRGHMLKKGESDEPIFDNNLPSEEIRKRVRIGDSVGSLYAQAKVTYSALIHALQTYAQQSQGLDVFTARKQARSAARYVLPNALSTEMVFTASIRNWRHIFEMRCSPHADSAIRELMERAQDAVKSSRYGHLL